MRDYASFGWRSHTRLTLIPFTSATASALAMPTSQGSFLRVPYACKLVAAYPSAVTGATAAVAFTQTLIKSVGGTGSATAVGTASGLGTTASGGPGAAATLGSDSLCTLAAGDYVGVCPSIATVAVVGTWAYDLLFEELPS